VRLRDKIALVTGAGSGIGRATALLFAKEGAKVLVVDIDSEGGRETAEIIEKMGGTAIFVEADVSKEADVKKIVEVVVDKYRKIDVLHNNAGVVLVKDLVDTGEKEWTKVLDVNLKGMFLVSKHTIPEMIKRGGGSIINTASGFGLTGAASYTAYCASKGGVIALTRAMAIELAPHNIRVNCICPGVVSTPMLDKCIRITSEVSGENEEETRKSWRGSQPLGRFGKPEEIAHAALYLASNESSYTTGAILSVDGGVTAQ
jgi:NAD(P)-dependent dehydrogenase (short-subunit alcohol dehydrogenase family)